MKIKEATPKQLQNVVAEAITEAFMVAGYHAPSTEDLASMLKLTIQDMLKYFRHNDLDDIKHVFDLGSHGEYGDYAGLSPRVFYQWMKTYNGIVVNVQPVEDETTQEPQRQTTPQDGRNLVNSCYQIYKTQHYCMVPAKTLLDILEREGVYIPSDWERADAEVRAEGLLTSNFLKGHELGVTLERFLNSGKASKASEIILFDFFNTCIENNQTKIF